MKKVWQSKVSIRNVCKYTPNQKGRCCQSRAEQSRLAATVSCLLHLSIILLQSKYCKGESGISGTACSPFARSNSSATYRSDLSCCAHGLCKKEEEWMAPCSAADPKNVNEFILHIGLAANSLKSFKSSFAFSFLFWGQRSKPRVCLQFCTWTLHRLPR